MHRVIKQGAVVGILACAVGAATGGCLSRDVESQPPNLGTTFTTVIASRAIDKVDILFDIDNSASMGDKQDYLRAAIPDLVNRFVNPNCVDGSGNPTGIVSNAGACPMGSKPEFTPVHDMHLGIVSSSLGMRGGDVCNPQSVAPAPYASVSAHNDDQAHLLNRTLTYTDGGVTEGAVADAPGSDPFLYWFPSGLNAGSTPTAGVALDDAGTLQADFADMVVGTGVFGCGIESQLESWYRFLVQPDPYESIVANDGVASWSGVDGAILKERHDFLRPDSLVLVVVLSDENDSEIDVRSIGGQAVHWMNSGSVPRGTSACATDPGSPACQSCAQGDNDKTDPTCIATPEYTDPHDWGYDLNLRHVHMKAKYGIDPQYPISRYVTGLTSTVVPDRNGEYPPGATSYVGTNDCQNPLFAASLPDGSRADPDTLCKTPPGPRTKDLVFYAHIGGVPHELLHFTPGNPKASTLTSADWTKILGNDPEHYDYSGIDPHMIESYAPRAGLPGPLSAPGADPISGHEWTTNQGDAHVLEVDRQYACTFPLVDSSGTPSPRDCSLAENQSFCDCPYAGTVTADELPPICDTTTQSLQRGAKAYPTIRELLLAEKVGTQGIVSSICPIDVKDNDAGTDPYYGYRPAVAVIVDRLKDALNAECLPQPLESNGGGGVSCLVLLQIPGTHPGIGGTCMNPICPASAGLSVPDPAVLGRYCQDLEDQYSQQVADNDSSAIGLTDPASVPVCVLQELTPANNPADFPGGTCANETSDRGWCYLTGTAAGSCPQSIVFSSGALPIGSSANLQCDEHSVTVLGGDAATAAGDAGL